MFEENNMSPGFCRIQAQRLGNEISSIDKAILHITDTRKFHYNILNLLRRASNPDKKSMEKVINVIKNLNTERYQLNKYEQMLASELQYYSDTLNKFESEILSAETFSYNAHYAPEPVVLKKEQKIQTENRFLRYFGHRLVHAR